VDLASGKAAAAPPPPPAVVAPAAPPPTVARPAAPANAALPGAAAARPAAPPVSLDSSRASASRPAPGDRAAEGDGSPPGAAPPPPSSGTTLGGKPPLKVAIVGDSMAGSMAPGLVQWANERGDVVVYNLAVIACPLSRGGTRRMSDGSTWSIDSECDWWARANSDRMTKFRQFAPDIVVIQDGLNELPDRRLPSWPTYWHTGQAQYDSWLVNEYTEAIKTLTAGGAKAMFLNSVCVDWDTLGQRWAGYSPTAGGDGDTRVSSLDRDDEAVAATGASVIDFQSHLCPHGKYTANVDGEPDGRPDGYHLSSAGSYALAARWLGPLVLQQAGTSGQVGAA